MPTVRLRADILRADRASADRWYVTNGATAVGPVQLELVERGIEAGKIPVESYIRHELWKIWRPLSELCITQDIGPIDPNGTPVVPFSIPFAADSGEFDPRETTMKPAMTAPRPLPDLRLPPSGADPLVMFAAVSVPPISMDPVSPREPLSSREPVSTAIPAILSVSDLEEIDPEADSLDESDSVATPRSVALALPHDLPQSLPPDIGPSFARDVQQSSAQDIGQSFARDVEQALPHDVGQALARALPPPRLPPPPPSVEDITLPSRAPRPNEKMTADPHDVTAQLKDALLTLSGVILREVGCDGVMVHRVDDEGAVAVVAHGPRMFDVLGLRTRLLDPAIVAAAAGILVVAEPTPGPAGRSVLSRLEKLGVTGTGAVMIPIRPNGRLFGTVELGQAAAFDGAAIAKAEGFVRVVQAKIEAADWKLDA